MALEQQPAGRSRGRRARARPRSRAPAGSRSARGATRRGMPASAPAAAARTPTSHGCARRRSRRRRAPPRPATRRAGARACRSRAGPHALATEERRGLVEDPARHADRPQLGPLARKRELERIELELRDRAECEPDGDLERSRRREARPHRQVRGDRSGETDRRPPEQMQLGGDRLRVARPAGGSRTASVRIERRCGTESLRDERHVGPARATSSEIPCWIATGSTSPPL